MTAEIINRRYVKASIAHDYGCDTNFLLGKYVAPSYNLTTEEY